MKFGHVSTEALSSIDFAFPSDTPATQLFFDSLPVSSSPPEVYVGCSVWTDRGFLGRVYPRGTPAKDFLTSYCRQFSTVELNTTFYGIPSVERIKKWKEAASSGFRFCPKLTRSISHRNNIDAYGHLVDKFLERVSHLGEHLGMSFMQLPVYFHPRSIQALQRFVERLPMDFSLAIELRHPDWFSDSGVQREVFSCFRSYHITAVITDVAGRRDVLHQALTSDTAFIRFVGNNLHASDYTRIDAWVDRLGEWARQGLLRIYFLLHEPEKYLCADLAVYMVEQLNKKMKWKLQPPRLTPQQGKFL